MPANTLKFKNSQRKENNSGGFTLMEMAIGMLILGLLMAPAISAYNLYQKNKKIDQTEFALGRASTNLEGYLNAFGRYPCPAPIDVPSGDVRYGFEARDGAGNCEFAPAVTGVTRVANTDPLRPNPNVLIGKLPFKTLNLQENEIFDGYGGRLTYAVSEVQTDELTYSPNEGAVGIEKIDDSTGLPVSLLSVPNSAHFVVVSHGLENSGGYASGGVLSGTCASTLAVDQENCDGDAVFMFSEETIAADDTLAFVGGKTVTPWQYATGNTSDIHLKTGGENVISGAPNLFSDTSLLDQRLALNIVNEGRDDQINADCNSLPFTNVCLELVDNFTDLGAGQTARDICAADLNAPECLSGFSGIPDDSDGILRVENEMDPLTNAEIANTGGVISNEICNADPTNPDCFNPNIIGGAHNPNPAALPAGGALGAPYPGARYGGVTAPSGTGDGGNMACPNGEVMVGIDDGQIVCTDTVSMECPSGEYLAGISTNGELRCGTAPQPACPATNVTNSCGGSANLPGTAAGTYELAYSGECHEIAAFDASLADTFTTLAELQNYVDNLNNAIRTSSSCNLVRDRFDCPSGNFNSTPGRVHEKRRSNQNFRNPNSSSDAETLSHSGYAAYNASNPMSVHPANNNGNHDCWCREDYRIVTSACSTGSGNEYTVQKYPCPQTAERWVHEYDTGNNFCTCVPGTGTQNGGSCASRIPGSFDSSGVTGNVIDDTAISCPYATTVTGSSFANCRCPARSDQFPTVACPSNTTNSFTFEGIPYTDVQSVQHRRWTCPSVTGDLDTAAEVGFWTVTSHTEPCSCNNNQSGYRVESCPADQLGQRRIETRLDCSLNPPNGQFVDASPQNIIQDCQGCIWTKPSAGSPSYSDDTLGARPVGSTCNCNTDMSTTRLCREPNGSGYDIFGGCSCQPQ